MNRSLVARWLMFAMVLMSLVMTWSTASTAQIAVGISVRIGPPALPVYEQPFCPGPGYLWTPGYWAWSDDDGYYWVPGTWVVAPVGMLWTPGYWGWGGGFYAWHAGYWGPHVGFYGGINYGFGYGGVGFFGGEWRGGGFFYNSAVTRVNTVNVTNVYVNKTVIVNNNTRVAYNGGEGGIQARATPQEEAYSREPHQAPVAAQVQHEHAASQNRALFASQNHGRPEVAATARPGEFSGHGVVAAKAAGGTYHAPAISPREARVSSPASNGAKGNTGANNNGFHSFTPPNKSNTANSSRGATSPANHNPPSNNNNARQFTPPPSSSHSSNARQPNNEARPQNSGRQNEPRPQSQPHSAPSHSSPPPRQSAPKAAPHQNPPSHESAPHEPEKHPGKGH